MSKLNTKVLCCFLMVLFQICNAQDPKPKLESSTESLMVTSQLESVTQEKVTSQDMDITTQETITQEMVKNESEMVKNESEMVSRKDEFVPEAMVTPSELDTGKSMVEVNETVTPSEVFTPIPAHSQFDANEISEEIDTKNDTQIDSENTSSNRTVEFDPSKAPMHPDYTGYDDEDPRNRLYAFSCYGRQFGQYADVTKDCHIFHLCYPYLNISSGRFIYQRISFLCDQNSVFDQKNFRCVDNSSIEYNCDESPQYYVSSNQNYLNRLMTLINGVGPVVSGEPNEVHNHTSHWIWSMFRN